jgi:hypothetical protein
MWPVHRSALARALRQLPRIGWRTCVEDLLADLADLHDGLDLDRETQGQCGDPDSGPSGSTRIPEDPRQQIRGAVGHQVLLGEVGC